MHNHEAYANRMAVMGGAYGNVPALQACLRDARTQQCDTLAFIGDALGCCGHSDEILALVRAHFDVLVAGNLEQQAAAGAQTCGCGYASEEDERISCQAFTYALDSLSETNRVWLGTWPERQVVPSPLGNVLLCHGSPDATNEFLYASQLEEDRLRDWLAAYEAIGILCTHTGLPWVHTFGNGRFAANGGVVGKPDHDSDPAVHYALVDLTGRVPSVVIRRVEYDYQGWADQLACEGVASIFIQPLRTGIWTTGVVSLPAAEQHRPGADQLSSTITYNQQHGGTTS